MAVDLVVRAKLICECHAEGDRDPWPNDIAVSMAAAYLAVVAEREDFKKRYDSAIEAYKIATAAYREKVAQIEASEAARDRLKAALEKYGQHLTWCTHGALREIGKSCTCGFEALAEPETPREAPQPRYTSLDDGRRTPFEPYADSPRAEKEG